MSKHFPTYEECRQASTDAQIIELLNTLKKLYSEQIANMIDTLEEDSVAGDTIGNAVTCIHWTNQLNCKIQSILIDYIAIESENHE